MKKIIRFGMVEKEKTPIFEDHLGIHVMSSSVGESIIVTLPDGTWFVVDAFSGAPSGTKPKDVHAVCAFLKRFRLQYEKCRFVLLSHLHQDHYEGLPGLLNDMRVNGHQPLFRAHYAYQNEANHAYIEEVLSLNEMQAHPENRRVRSRDILKLCRKEYEPISRTEIVSTHSSRGDPCHVYCFGPTTDIVNEYFQSSAIKEYPLKASKRAISRLIKDRNKIFNNMSTLLAIEFNHYFVVLGADAESHAWDSILGETPSNREALPLTKIFSAVGIIKIPHHGSYHAWSDPLEQLYERSLSSIVTHHVRGTYRLPDKRGLEQILKKNLTIAVPDKNLLSNSIVNQWKTDRIPFTHLPVYLGSSASKAEVARVGERIRNPTQALKPEEDEVQWASISFDAGNRSKGWFGGSRLVFLKTKKRP